MKKLIAIALLLACVLSLASCGGKTAAPSDASPTASSQEAPAAAVEAGSFLPWASE